MTPSNNGRRFPISTNRFFTSVSTSFNVHGLIFPPTMLEANGGIAEHDCVIHCNVGDISDPSEPHIYSVVAPEPLGTNPDALRLEI